MVVYFMTIGRNNLSLSTREFAGYLKKNVLAVTDYKKVIPIDLSTMKDLIMNSLDSLLKTNDELQRWDFEIEGFIKTLEKKLLELSPKFEFKVHIKNIPYNLEEAISNFSWDEQKYPKNQKLIENILEKILDKYNTTRNFLKTKTDNYQKYLDNLKEMTKSENEAASLMKEDYRCIVKSSMNNMIQTDYLTTILCFVPNQMVEQFSKGYQDLAEGMVLPLSAIQLDRNQDDKNSLWRVVVMKHKKNDFINEVRAKYRVTAKEFDRGEIDRLPDENKKKESLIEEIAKEKRNLIENCDASYSEIYQALLHLKHLRLYTESTLKYGTEPYFSCIISTVQGKETKVVSDMIKRFSDIKDSGWYGTKEELKETEDFYPFILIKLGVPSFI